MLQTNPEIDHVVVEATKIAVQFNHEYVTLEHLLLSVLRYDPVKTLLSATSIDVTGLDADIDAYLLAQTHLVVENIEPRKTHALERVFNRALTQVLFSGRTQMQLMDLLLSIHSETKSYAQYFIMKYGLSRDKMIELYAQVQVDESKNKVVNAEKAEKILNFYCDNKRDH